MIDTVNGKIRIRAWPRKRPKKHTPEEQERLDQFAAYQWAAKYISPQQMVDVMKGREGTPILPRDALTAMWSGRLMPFIRPNGKVLWPMPAYIDTSEALDTVSQTPGESLRRGAEGWEGFNPATNAEAVFHKVFDLTLAAPAAQVLVPDIVGWRELIILMLSATKSVSGLPLVRFSTDNGATYRSTLGDYILVAAAGTTTGITGCGLHETNATAARTGVMRITLNVDGTPPVIESVNRAEIRLFVQSIDPVTDLQIIPSAGGNFNAGRFIVLAK